MKQLTQQLKSGFMQIIDVPFPVMGSGQVLVRNHFSVISPGTEGKTVSDARKGYLAKAKTRQKEFKMVLESIKTEGLKKTYDVVMSKLEAPSPLGYSCAGEVIAVGDNVRDLVAGDFVACGGGSAFHAEIVSVHRNLCVKLPPSVLLEHAAFTTIAAIAIQGIRQADLRLGENCTVIGLGLVGLLTIQILKASGMKAIGVDIDSMQVQRAHENGADLAVLRADESIVQSIIDATGGYGTDAVIITAATSSNDPIEFAGEICRKKGKVVIVGAVPTGFSRTNYYRKELELRMSTSYGPGRSDPIYEDKGIDYPIGYVRFTENRNMQTFVDLLSENKLNIDNIITNRFSLNSASEAYELILSKEKHPIGILLNYETDVKVKSEVLLHNRILPFSSLCIGFIGAGNFAQNVVLPIIENKCDFIGIATAEGNISRYVAGKYGFKYCTDDPAKIIEDPEIGTVFILTRHDTHARFAIEALKMNKNVVLEKPLAMNLDELQLVKRAFDSSSSRLMLGFNRRFSPLTQRVMKMLPEKLPRAINIRINAGVVPADHWVHDLQVGGGRIVGEACHFIDLATFLAGSIVVKIHALSLHTKPQLRDSVVINLEFANGSIANVSYYSNGNKQVPKERIEVFCGGTYFLIDDFKNLTISSENNKNIIKQRSQDKGHKNQFNLILDSLKNNSEFPIPFDQIYHSSLITLLVLESISGNRSIEVAP